MALHTSPNCIITPSPQLATSNSANCDGSTNGNKGCGSLLIDSASYGAGFNSAGGGVYAMEWTSAAIKIWFFPRNAIPENIKSKSAVTGSWGTPQAIFEGGSGCDIDGHFRENNIVFDTTFCGDWAASVWQQDATCKGLAPTCSEYVAENPSAFKNAYWSIDSVEVYTTSDSSPRPPRPKNPNHGGAYHGETGQYEGPTPTQGVEYLTPPGDPNNSRGSDNKKSKPPKDKPEKPEFDSV